MNTIFGRPLDGLSAGSSVFGVSARRTSCASSAGGFATERDRGDGGALLRLEAHARRGLGLRDDVLVRARTAEEARAHARGAGVEVQRPARARLAGDRARADREDARRRAAHVHAAELRREPVEDLVRDLRGAGVGRVALERERGERGCAGALPGLLPRLHRLAQRLRARHRGVGRLEVRGRPLVVVLLERGDRGVELLGRLLHARGVGRTIGECGRGAEEHQRDRRGASDTPDHALAILVLTGGVRQILAEPRHAARAKTSRRRRAACTSIARRAPVVGSAVRGVVAVDHHVDRRAVSEGLLHRARRYPFPGSPRLQQFVLFSAVRARKSDHVEHGVTVRAEPAGEDRRERGRERYAA